MSERMRSFVEESKPSPATEVAVASFLGTLGRHTEAYVLQGSWGYGLASDSSDVDILFSGVDCANVGRVIGHKFRV